MQSQPATSPLGILLMIGAIYLLFLVPGAILRIGDPEAWGRIGGLAALLVTVIIGWWHIRNLRSAEKEAHTRPGD